MKTVSSAKIRRLQDREIAVHFGAFFPGVAMKPKLLPLASIAQPMTIPVSVIPNQRVNVSPVGATALPPNAALNSDPPRITRDKCGEAEGAADVACVDQMLLVEQVFGVSGNLPLALG
jgi:hypothetical protein